MKVVIFAGGFGTRISEESHLKPKPMIEIGGWPILWHIMKYYESYGFNEFIICLGYKGYIIKDFFLNYYMYSSDISISLASGKIDVHFSDSNTFKVTLVDTGLETKTAGRLKRVQKYLNNEDFMLTYGDGLSDVNLHELVEFHKTHGKIATLTSVKPAQTFGRITFDESGKILHFREKSQEDSIWINGGFFVLNPKVFDFIPEGADNIMWEETPMDKLTESGELYAFKHNGFWKCMDAIRDKIELEDLWKNEKAKWKIWKM